MMLETLTIIAVVALAAGFSGWRVYQTLRVAKGKQECGGCAKCPTEREA